MIKDEAVEVEQLLLDVGGEVLSEEGEALARPLPVEAAALGDNQSRGVAEGEQRSGGRPGVSQLHVVDGGWILINTSNNFPATTDQLASVTVKRKNFEMRLRRNILVS